MCATRISLGLMINTGVLLASSRRLIFSGLISVQPFIGWTIKEFSISSFLWALDVLCCLHWDRFSHWSLHVIVESCHSELINIVSRVLQGSDHYCSTCAPQSLFLFRRIRWLVMLISYVQVILVLEDHCQRLHWDGTLSVVPSQALSYSCRVSELWHHHSNLTE